MAIKNMAASVLTRLKIQSKEEKISFQIILQLFAQEEFLRKLSYSKYIENLILKGGVSLISSRGLFLANKRKAVPWCGCIPEPSTHIDSTPSEALYFFCASGKE